MSERLVDVLAKHRILARLARVLERTRQAHAFCAKETHTELREIERALDALEQETAQQIDDLMAHRYKSYIYTRRRAS